MDAANAGRVDAATDGTTAAQLVRTAAALRWTRPDLTATLAELAVEAATDAATWVGAAGWLLHGRAAVGDGRDTASDLLDGLGRWGEYGTELMVGPTGRRLRIELAGPARHVGEPGIARKLLAADPDDGEADLELRADALTELARCALDNAPDTADDALLVAEQAWQAAACSAGVASVMLLGAARHRRAGRADLATGQATDGLKRVNEGARRAGATESDHVAAALTTEWIAALVEAGRVDEARSEALPPAHRLIVGARSSRQVGALRLAIARVLAVAEPPDVVIAALEPAVQNAADNDVPELESACRSMLGELHEAAGRLDAALGAVRAAMSAERRDRDRGARLRRCLAAVATTWAGEPSRPLPARRHAVPAGAYGLGGPIGFRDPLGGPGPGAVGPDDGHDPAGETPFRRPDRGSDPAGPANSWVPEPAGGNQIDHQPAASPLGPESGRRRARRLAAELSSDPDGPGARDRVADLRDQVGSTPPHRLVERSGPRAHGGERPRRTDEPVAASVPAERAQKAGAWSDEGGTLIGDALLRELGVAPLDDDAPSAPQRRVDPDAADGVRGDVWNEGPAGHDDRPYGDTGPDGGDARTSPARSGRVDPDGLFGPEQRQPGAPAESTADDLDSHAVSWDGPSTWPELSPALGDTVIFGIAEEHGAPAWRRSDGPPVAADQVDAMSRGARSERHLGRDEAGFGGPDTRDHDAVRDDDTGGTVWYDRSRDGLPHHGDDLPDDPADELSGHPGDGGRRGRADDATGYLDRGPGWRRRNGPMNGAPSYGPDGPGESRGGGTPRAGRYPNGYGRHGRAASNAYGTTGAPDGAGRHGHGAAGPSSSTIGNPCDAGSPGGVPANGHVAGTSEGAGGYVRRTGGWAPGTAAPLVAADPDGPPSPGAATWAGGPHDVPGSAPPGRRGAVGSGPGRPPSTDPDGLGLADLLAGALAAYRNM